MANEILALAARAQDINFVTKFESDLHNLLAVLGKSEVQVMAPGSALKVFNTSGTLNATAVAEKALIPDSGITTDNGTVVELAYKKYRNLTSIEKIGKIGYDAAVGASNDALLKLVQKAVRQTIYTGIATGTGTASAIRRVTVSSNPARVPSASTLLTTISPAPSSTARFAHSTASIPVNSRKPRVVIS